MTVRYSKIFTVIGAITCEPVTILVEYVEAKGFRGIFIESLEGEYHSANEFRKASKRVIEDMNEKGDKMYTSLSLMPPDAHRLMDVLTEALSEDASSFLNWMRISLLSMIKVELDQRMRKSVEQLIRNRPELGYLNTEDFIRDAIRHFLQEDQELHISQEDCEQQY